MMASMLGLNFGSRAENSLRVLCLGAHSDDIEIGCGGTLLKLCAEHPEIEVRWVVLSAAGARAEEARRSAELFLRSASGAEVLVESFRDGFFPYIGAEIKEYFEELKRGYSPNLIFSHYGADRHQDHRLVSELTWNTFRSHLVLEYEIPKYDGGLGSPNLFVPLTQAQQSEKIELLMTAFPSQREKHWFTPETFSGLMRLRGIEAAAPAGFAEGFYARKLVLGTTSDTR
jgi:LmbE family N-acetylglucosaminyl deacetylase